MWHNEENYDMKKQCYYYLFYIVGALFSLVLDIQCEDIEKQFFSAPFNIILLAAMLFVVFAFGRQPSVVFFGTLRGASLVIAGFSVACLSLGLFSHILSLNSYVVLYTVVMLLFSLAVTASRRSGKFTMKNLSFWVNHWCLFFFIASLFFGAADSNSYYQKAIIKQSSDEVYTPMMLKTVLPFSVEVEEFIIERGENGAVNNYSAAITATEADGEQTKIYTKVNAPAYYEGYDIYLQSYDAVKGEDSSYVILNLTHQPWRWITLLACVGLIFGSIISFICVGSITPRPTHNDN